MPKNRYSHGGITDVNSADMRCYQDPSSVGKTAVAPIAAGTNITFTIDPNMFHPGPLQYYMAAAPDGQNLATWEPAGAVWFKVEEVRPRITDSGLKWLTDGICSSIVNEYVGTNQ
jgi:hypothetical protein